MRAAWLALLAGCGADLAAPAVPPAAIAARDSDRDGHADDTDCDDADPTRHPGAAEACDGVDQDCDGLVDEGAPGNAERWPDRDGDGYGVWFDHPAKNAPGCPTETGWSIRGGDCDDADPAEHIDAPDVCGDDVDRDCVPGCAPRADLADARAIVIGGAEWPSGEAVVLDFDGDGANDLAVAGDGVWLLPGPITGVVDGEQARRFAMEGGRPKGTPALLATDLDGDGPDDLVYAAPMEYCWGACDDVEGGAVWLLHGPDAPALVEPGVTPGLWRGVARNAAAVADLDRDGTTELLVGAPGAGTVEIWPITGEPFPWAPPATVSGEGFGEHVLTADLDGDGAADLLVWDGSAAWVFAGPVPAGATAADAAARIDGGWATGSPSAGDVDGDGAPDLLLPPSPDGWRAGRARMFRGPFTGDRAADDATATVLLGSYHDVDTAIADVDGDGDGDLILGEPGAGPAWRGAVYVVRGPVEGALVAVDDADRRWIGDPGTRLGARVDAGDLDGDGLPEILAGALDRHEGPQPTLYALGW